MVWIYLLRGSVSCRANDTGRSSILPPFKHPEFRIVCIFIKVLQQKFFCIKLCNYSNSMKRSSQWFLENISLFNCNVYALFILCRFNLKEQSDLGNMNLRAHFPHPWTFDIRVLSPAQVRPSRLHRKLFRSSEYPVQEVQNPYNWYEQNDSRGSSYGRGSLRSNRCGVREGCRKVEEETAERGIASKSGSSIFVYFSSKSNEYISLSVMIYYPDKTRRSVAFWWPSVLTGNGYPFTNDV